MKGYHFRTGRRLVKRLGFTPLSPALKAAMLCIDTRTLSAWHRMNGEFIGEGFNEIQASISQPCLLYAGEKTYEYSNVQRAAQEIPGASFVGIPVGEHLEGGDRVNVLKRYTLRTMGGKGKFDETQDAFVYRFSVPPGRLQHSPRRGGSDWREVHPC